MKEPNRLERVLAALVLEPMTPRQLAQLLSISPWQASEALQQLQARSQVQLLSNGRAWIRTPRQRRAA